MQGKLYKVTLDGRYAKFRKPLFNRNPMTYHFITKSALWGLIAASNQIERSDNRSNLKEYLNGFEYGIQLHNPIVTENISMKLSNLQSSGVFRTNQLKALGLPNHVSTPNYQEYLIDYKCTVYIIPTESNTEELIRNFINNVKNNVWYYTPVLGSTECIANITNPETVSYEVKNGDFSTNGFVTTYPKVKYNTLTSIDNLIKSVDDKYDSIEYEKVFYNKTGEISSNGTYYESDNYMFQTI